MVSLTTVKLNVRIESLPGFSDRFISLQTSSYLRLFHARSIMTLSTHLPFPSILILIPLEITELVNSSDVN
jgi:hypothetical protein